MGALSGIGIGTLSDSSGYCVILIVSRFWSGGTRINPMSRFHASDLSAPTEAMRFLELGCSGNLETSSFQGLSGGKTWRAARILSASGVLNITGCLIAGMGGN